MRIEFITWPLMGIMMGGWAWMQYHKGELDGKHYLWFCAMMMGGQIGGSIDCYVKGNLYMVFVQIYFFAFTLWGAIQRYREMKAKLAAEACQGGVT